MKKLTEEDFIQREEADCEADQKGTCGNCSNNLNVNPGDFEEEFFWVRCSSCDSVNQVSLLRVQEAQNKGGLSK